MFRPLAIVVLVFALCCHADDWRFATGVGTRNQAPIVALLGIGYKDVILRVQGMGAHRETNHFWCAIRGSLLWTFFRELPFNFDAGVGGGYEYARAPNDLYQSINKANGTRVILPYNYKEIGDVSLELWTHLYGIYTQISVPAYRIIKHDASRVLWGVGYMVEF